MMNFVALWVGDPANRTFDHVRGVEPARRLARSQANRFALFTFVSCIRGIPDRRMGRYRWEVCGGGNYDGGREGQVSKVGGDAVRGRGIRKRPGTAGNRPVVRFARPSLRRNGDRAHESVVATRVAEPNDAAVVFGERISLHGLDCRVSPIKVGPYWRWLLHMNPWSSWAVGPSVSFRQQSGF